jgi:hypothetical protein
MSGLNPDAMNEEKLCGIPQRTEQTLLTNYNKKFNKKINFYA